MVALSSRSDGQQEFISTRLEIFQTKKGSVRSVGAYFDGRSSMEPSK